MNPPPPRQDPSRPAAYPRRVLVCMVGLSPAVVTETFHALSTLLPDPFVPTEVHVVTTAAGDEALRRLLAPRPAQGTNVWDQMLDEVLPPGAPRPALDAHVHVVSRAGQRLDDIVDPADQIAVADTLLAVLRPLAADEHCAIHASLAGGRKSMGFYMGYAMSLLARAQDQLSHVLVSPSWLERHPGFFFPSRSGLGLQTPEGDPFHSAQAQVTLAPVSFVRMADGGADWLRHQDMSFDRAVAMAQQALAPQPVTLQVSERRLVCGSLGPGRERISVALSPQETAWYAYLASRRIAGECIPGSDEPGMVKLGKDFQRSVGLDLAELARWWTLAGASQDRSDAAIRQADLETACRPEYARAVFSEIRAKLLEALGPQAGRRLQILGPGERGKRDGLYGLSGIAPELLTVNQRVATG